MLDIFLSKPSIIYCDNLGATYLSMNSIMHFYTKHVDIDDHFVRDWVKQKVYKFVFSQARPIGWYLYKALVNQDSLPSDQVSQSFQTRSARMGILTIPASHRISSHMTTHWTEDNAKFSRRKSLIHVPFSQL